MHSSSPQFVLHAPPISLNTHLWREMDRGSEGQNTGVLTGVQFLAGARSLISSPQCPDRVWGPVDTDCPVSRNKAAGTWN
jgi:hypothetical protein